MEGVLYAKQLSVSKADRTTWSLQCKLSDHRSSSHLALHKEVRTMRALHALVLFVFALKAALRVALSPRQFRCQRCGDLMLEQDTQGNPVCTCSRGTSDITAW